MFISDDLLYIQMPKTGCTQIAYLLGKIFDGHIHGKHNPASSAQQSSGKIMLSSIRNPWDWYLSLWTFGCTKNGYLYNRLSKKAPPTYTLHKYRKSPLLGLIRCSQELFRKTENWHKIYADPGDPGAFRQWLRLIHQPAARQILQEEGLALQFSDLFGFMTFRYLRLCCQNSANLVISKSHSKSDEIRDFDRHNCYIDHFIRQENLEDDLYKVIENIRPLTDTERRLIEIGRRRNTSLRPFPISYYYDMETVEYVRSLDHLIVDKFNYRSPLDS